MGGKSKRGSRSRPITSRSPSPDTPRTLVQQEHMSQTIVTGPIPPPETLQGYAQIDRDFPKRIIKMAEDEQTHRHSMEQEALDAQIENLKRDRLEARFGQVFALAIGLVAIGGGVLAAIQGAQWSGSIIGGGGVIGLVSVFIYGRRSTTPPDEHKR